MAVYAVNQAQPLSVFPQGYQSETTLYNKGPATVYAGATTAVTPRDGYEIAPLTSARWRANRPLFLVTDSVQGANVIVDDAAINGDVSRAEVYDSIADNLISRGSGVLINVPRFECTSYNTLLLTLKVEATEATIGYFYWEVRWTDKNNNILNVQKFATWASRSSGQCSLRVPVLGYGCSIYMVRERGPFFTNMTLNVIGTTRSLVFSWRNEYPCFLDGTRVSDGSSNGTNDGVYLIVDYGVTNKTDLLLPGGISNILTVTHRYDKVNPATDGSVRSWLWDAYNSNNSLSNPWYSMYDIPVEAAWIRLFRIPQTRPVAISHFALTQSHILQLTYTDA